MPELPEVETTRRGIVNHIRGRKIEQVIVRQRNLRWPIPRLLNKYLSGHVIEQVTRRGKYLLFHLNHGVMLCHLGMSGSLRIAKPDEPTKTHDHVDICCEKKIILRYHDPRRFGAILWAGEDPCNHPLLAKLGPEPLSKQFSGQHLWRLAQGRRSTVKIFIMNAAVVVGVGNIYATEALFAAGINPLTPVNTISLTDYENLVKIIKEILRAAIRQGGTTLKDFVGGNGKPGYFKQSLQVYGRQGEACYQCSTPIQSVKLSQRASAFCPGCQQSHE